MLPVACNDKKVEKELEKSQMLWNYTGRKIVDFLKIKS
jgi:hypothetical protein